MLYALVPVKSLERAKGRLAPLLTPSERRALVLAMLDDVLGALGNAPAVAERIVISRDAQVLEAAARAGATPLYDHADGLNGSLDQAARYAAARGASATLVLPADVPLVTAAAIERLNGDGARGVALSPSRDGGTNAMLLRPAQLLPFLFGPDSLARHQEAARLLHASVRLVDAPELALDVDRPHDLRLLASSPGASAAQRLARTLKLSDRSRQPCFESA